MKTVKDAYDFQCTTSKDVASLAELFYISVGTTEILLVLCYSVLPQSFLT